MKLHVLTLAALVAIGMLAAGGAFEAVDVTTDAAAYCNTFWKRVTGDCNSCETAGRAVADPYEKLTGQPYICPA